MGLYDNVYLYACPMPGPLDAAPPEFPPMPGPFTPEKCREAIGAFMAIPALDEFAIMRALDALDDGARARVLEWLKVRCAKGGK